MRKIVMLGFGKKRRQRKIARRWHKVILSAARAPEAYQRGWVEDTLDGRFQMVTLITTQVLRRLRDCGPPGREMADLVYREVFSGFDHALREQGVGDASIARKVRKMGEEFFGLARAVDAAFDNAPVESDLAGALTRNGVCDEVHAPVFAKSLIGMDQAIRAQAFETLLNCPEDAGSALVQG